MEVVKDINDFASAEVNIDSHPTENGEVIFLDISSPVSAGGGIILSAEAARSLGQSLINACRALTGEPTPKTVEEIKSNIEFHTTALKPSKSTNSYVLALKWVLNEPQPVKP